MPPESQHRHLGEADTISILVATDNHVGYAERDHIRGDDAWKTFHEIMDVAKARDVDMVLLAGDLFHENKPSRKSMFNVMRSLRLNCLGDKPCELQMLSDASENFGGTFDHVNYEDEDINVAIPVFSIHGNHDDPTEEGRYAALDLLQMSGFVNYFGKTPESDNISVKPVLLQKGGTKLALYGLSNVRDERLFRTFRDGKVKFFQPSTQKNDWFNLIAVHQNHHAHTTTGYLPENFLPEFLDLVIWGHEHECLIEPRYNPEMSFHVMQPGSSVATSLAPGEAVQKRIAIMKVTGKEFKCEYIRLKTVRPFVMKEIVLAEEPALKNTWKKDNNRTEITTHLVHMVDGLIDEARLQFMEAQDGEAEDVDIPLPLIRLRVEYTAPDGGRFDCENPQRFSNRFQGRVANETDVIQFYRKKVTASRKTKNEPDMPEESVIAQLSLDHVKVEKLVREFLTAQSLTILPQNTFGDAVSQFVDKDDKHSMEIFVDEALTNQMKHLVSTEGEDEDVIEEAMEQYRSNLEELFAAGHLNKRKKRARVKPKPDGWDSEFDGPWEDEPAAIIHSEGSEDEGEAEEANTGRGAVRGRGRGRGRGGATATTRKTAPAKRAPAKATTSTRGKKKIVEEDDDEESDMQMVLDNDDDESDSVFVKQAPVRKAPPKRTPAPRTKATSMTGPSGAKQSTLNFTQPSQTQRASTRTAGRQKPIEISDDDISDDDAFEPAPPSNTRGRR